MQIKCIHYGRGKRLWTDENVQMSNGLERPSRPFLRGSITLDVAAAIQSQVKHNTLIG